MFHLVQTHVSSHPNSSDFFSLLQDWISDRARWQYDGLKRQRLGVPMVRGATGQLETASWRDTLAAVQAAGAGVPGHQMRALAGAHSTWISQCFADRLA